MIDHTQAIGLSAALLMGLAGSAHCFGMCGGIAGALGMRSRSRVGESPRISLDASLYQIGRISGYIILGTLAGAIGATLQSIVDLAQVGIAFALLAVCCCYSSPRECSCIGMGLPLSNEQARDSGGTFNR